MTHQNTSDMGASNTCPSIERLVFVVSIVPGISFHLVICFAPLPHLFRIRQNDHMKDRATLRWRSRDTDVDNPLFCRVHYRHHPQRQFDRLTPFLRFVISAFALYSSLHLHDLMHRAKLKCAHVAVNAALQHPLDLDKT